MKTTERALKPVTAAFVAGMFATVGVMSLAADYMGPKGWTEWELANWISTKRSVPMAIFMLVVSLVVFFWAAVVVPRVKFVTRLASVWRQKTPRAELVALVGAASGHIDNVIDGTTHPVKGVTQAYNLLQQAQYILKEMPEGQWRDDPP